MLLLDLLIYAAAESPSALTERVLTSLSRASEREVRWALDAGLGPLLYRATGADRTRVPSVWRDVFLAADLTAKVMHGNRIEATAEIIDVCNAIGARVTLLKGISISDQHYPTAHLRPMSDIDVLIPEPSYERVESKLLSLGYRRGADPRLLDHHHGVPLHHPVRRVWLELHTTLFPKSSNLHSNSVFGAAQLASQTIGSTFGGRPVTRFTDELQLAYIASSWVWDLTLRKIHPSFVAGLLDAVYLLKDSEKTLDWDGMLGWLDNEMAAASLHLMLSYLCRRGLSSCPVLTRLRSSQRLVGSLELRVMHAMLDHYLIGGRSWNLFMPPPVPGRYNLRRQLKKRRPKLGSGAQ